LEDLLEAEREVSVIEDRISLCSVTIPEVLEQLVQVELSLILLAMDVSVKLLSKVNIYYLKIVKYVEVSLLGADERLEEASLSLLLTSQIQKGVDGKLVVAQKPILRYTLVHGVDLDILHPQFRFAGVLQPLLDLLNGHSNQLWVEREGVEVVVHELAGEKVGYNFIQPHKTLLQPT